MALRYEFLGRLRGDGDACFTCRGFGRYAYLHGNDSRIALRSDAAQQ
jgi:hypothetical protein